MFLIGSISFLVSQGASSTGNERADLFNFQCSFPSRSALNQQRDKLLPEAVEAVFHQLNPSLSKLAAPSGYGLLAADGLSFSFFSSPRWAGDEYFVSQGHFTRGFYSFHLNALYDPGTYIYEDAVIQSVHLKNEYKAFCTMVDRLKEPDGWNCIFIADCRYCSYNNMAHVLRKKQFFLFRSKDVDVRSMAGHLPVPKEEIFDMCLDIIIRRSRSKKHDIW